jgi:hypothetical protein
MVEMAGTYPLYLQEYRSSQVVEKVVERQVKTAGIHVQNTSDKLGDAWWVFVAPQD